LVTSRRPPASLPENQKPTAGAVVYCPGQRNCDTHFINAAVIKMNMSSLTSAALAAALIAAASVLAFALCPGLLVWPAFIGWASYDHSGGTVQAAVRSSAALVFGAIMAWLVAIVAASGLSPVNATASLAVLAGVASFLIVLASRLSLLSVVPATFYGFASTFAYLGHSAAAFTVESLTSLSLQNAVFSVSASLLIGTALGIVHAWLAGLLAGDVGKAKLGLSNGHLAKAGKP
jgi:hypothetical protein